MIKKLTKTLFEATGGFAHSVPTYQDLDLKLRLVLVAVGSITRGVVCTLFTQHDGGLSSAGRAWHVEWKAQVRAGYDWRGSDLPCPSRRQRRLSRLGVVLVHCRGICGAMG
jgi:hypothetical protein